MTYIAWVVVLLTAITLILFSKKQETRKVLLGGVVVLLSGLAIILWNIFLERGSLSEILLLQVPHRSSAYLSFIYGVLIAMAITLLSRLRSKE